MLKGMLKGLKGVKAEPGQEQESCQDAGDPAATGVGRGGPSAFLQQARAPILLTSLEEGSLTALKSPLTKQEEQGYRATLEECNSFLKTTLVTRALALDAAQALDNLEAGLQKLALPPAGPPADTPHMHITSTLPEHAGQLLPVEVQLEPVVSELLDAVQHLQLPVAAPGAGSPEASSAQQQQQTQGVHLTYVKPKTQWSAHQPQGVSLAHDALLHHLVEPLQLFEEVLSVAWERLQWCEQAPDATAEDAAVLAASVQWLVATAPRLRALAAFELREMQRRASDPAYKPPASLLEPLPPQLLVRPGSRQHSSQARGVITTGTSAGAAVGAPDSPPGRSTGVAADSPTAVTAYVGGVGPTTTHPRERSAKEAVLERLSPLVAAPSP